MQTKLLLIIFILGIGISPISAKSPQQSRKAEIDYSIVYDNAKGKVKKKKMKNGDYYVGEWAGGEANGYGMMQYVDGSTYTGYWLNGKPNGDGKMKYVDGSIYTGSWLNGEPNGSGEKTFPDKSSYVGEWANGLFNGEGKMLFANGDVYFGNWSYGKREGIGEMCFDNSLTYKGLWKDDKIVGDGHIQNKEYEYNGTFSFDYDPESGCPQNIIFEKGALSFMKPVKTTKNGEWSDGMTKFVGETQTPIWTFVGTMINDDFSDGKLTYNDKDWGTLKGKFKDGVIFDGESDGLISKTYLCGMSAKYYGDWKAGKFIGKFEGKIPGKNFGSFKLEADSAGKVYGSIITTNNATYTGEVKDMKFDGNGVLKFPDIEYSGLWKNGEWIEGKGEINNGYNDPIILTRSGHELIVKSPDKNLSGTYTMASFDLSNPLLEIKEKYEIKKQAEMQRYFDANYAGLIFKAKNESFDNSAENALAMYLFQAKTDATIMLLPGCKAALVTSMTTASTEPYENLFAGMMDGSKKIYDLKYDASSGDFIVEGKNSKIRISKDRNTAYYIYPEGTGFELKGVMKVGPITSGKGVTSIAPATYKGTLTIGNGAGIIKANCTLVITSGNRYKLTVKAEANNQMLSALSGGPQTVITSGSYKIVDGKLICYNDQGSRDGEFSVLLGGRSLYLNAGSMSGLLYK